ncbi:MAG: carboxymuconolactone decarboxylase family protein [Proteobacteria bacterium]|nr:MAG: carboxymuconolactone decarboxylase family protein [Pseudomonadota bacterium]
MSNRLDYTKLSGNAAQALFNLEKVVGESALDPKLKDLVRIRVSQLNGCTFCIDMHSKEAKIHGERELRLYHVAVWQESPLFDAREKAALGWAELLTRFQSTGVTDEEYERMLVTFSEKELSDLTFVVTTINAWNRLGVAFRTPLGKYDKVMGLDKAGLS